MTNSPSKQDIVVYAHALSPYALKVRSYLLYKQLPFEMIYVNPMRANKQLPVGKTVPVLGYQGEFRNESSEIGAWLDELFPDTAPLVQPDAAEALDWVDHRLIPGVFALFIGVNESIFTSARKRWAASDALNKTVPGGVTFKFRLLHLFYIHQAPFIVRLIQNSGFGSDSKVIKAELTHEFETSLKGAPFLGGRQSPSIADVSALPLIVVPYLRGEKHYLLQSELVNQWVARMLEHIPNYKALLPGVLLKR